MIEPEDDENRRLRRHLRAVSAVNRQLQAQLEGGAIVGASGPRLDDDLLATTGGRLNRASFRVRRVAVGDMWLEQLQLYGGAGTPFLVRASSRGVFVVEGALRRKLNSGLLFAALRRELGPARDVSDSEVEGWREGPPVEVLEGGSGPPFVVVGGRRLPIRNLPLPHPVSTDDMMIFPEGEELDVAARLEGPQPGNVSRTRDLLAREGPARTLAMLIRRVENRLRRPRRSNP